MAKAKAIKDPSLPATDKQVEGIIRRLGDGREVEEGVKAGLLAALDRGLTKGQASAFIGLLDGMAPERGQPNGDAAWKRLPAGHYRHPTKGLCEVCISKAGNPYAGIVGGRYERGLVTELTIDMRVAKPLTPVERLARELAGEVVNLDA